MLACLLTVRLTGCINNTFDNSNSRKPQHLGITRCCGFFAASAARGIPELLDLCFFDFRPLSVYLDISYFLISAHSEIILSPFADTYFLFERAAAFYCS